MTGQPFIKVGVAYFYANFMLRPLYKWLPGHQKWSNFKQIKYLFHLKLYALSPGIIRFELSSIIKKVLFYKTLQYAN